MSDLPSLLYRMVPRPASMISRYSGSLGKEITKSALIQMAVSLYLMLLLYRMVLWSMNQRIVLRKITLHLRDGTTEIRSGISQRILLRMILY
ncbi:hypothetical protein D3C81_767520 [compost metagenome]